MRRVNEASVLNDHLFLTYSTWWFLNRAQQKQLSTLARDTRDWKQKSSFPLSKAIINGRIDKADGNGTNASPSLATWATRRLALCNTFKTQPLYPNTTAELILHRQQRAWLYNKANTLLRKQCFRFQVSGMAMDNAPLATEELRLSTASLRQLPAREGAIFVFDLDFVCCLYNPRAA